MAKATWKGTVIAESDDTVVVEGNHYFPRDAIRADAFERTEHTSVCPWKGTANYFTVVVEGERNENAAWTYESPKSAASAIKDRVAFWRGVEVVE